MRKIKAFGKKIVVSILIFMQLIAYAVVSFADSYNTEQHGQALAQFAVKYIDENQDRLFYDSYQLDHGGDWSGRIREDGRIGFVCTTFVMYIYKTVLGFDMDPRYAMSDDLYNDALAGVGAFYPVDRSEVKPGDIWIKCGHAMLSLGGTNVAHAANSNDGVLYKDVGSYTNEFIAVRLKPEIDVQLLTTLDAMGGDNIDYNYYGMPSPGRYVGSTTISFQRIFNKLSQLADYIIGIMFTAIKIQLIGWGTIFENMVSSIVEGVTGESIESEEEETQPPPEEVEGEEDEDGDGKTLYVPSAIEKLIDSGIEKMKDDQDRITVEKIIYNQVPILDINVFEQDYAGGEKLNPDGTLKIIRDNIAKWYYTLRQASIIIMLVILIYIGMRMALSTLSSQKVKYKRLLIDWIYGFVLIFFIHYFIMFMIQINNNLVEIFKQSQPNQEYTIYETVRTKAYELKFTSGFTGTVMYLFLVYLLVRFLYIYFKRYLTINILIMVAPIIGFSYALDRVKDAKSQSLITWAKDLFFNIIIQSVHALIYTIFVPVALQVSEDSLVGVFLAIIIMNFILKAEKLIIFIFNIDAPSISSTIKNATLSNAVAFMQFTKASWFKRIAGAPYRAATGVVKKTGRVIGDVGAVVLPRNLRYRANGVYNGAMERIWGEGNYLRRRTDDLQLNSDIEQRQREEVKKKKALTKKMLKQNVAFGKDIVKGAALTMAAIPIMIASPKTGITLALNGMTPFRKYTRKKNEKWDNPIKAERARRKAERARTGKKTRKIKSAARVLGQSAVLVVAAPGIHVKERHNQFKEDSEATMKNIRMAPEKNKMLEEERKLEAELALLYKKKNEEDERLVNASSNDKLKQSIKEKQEKEFNKVINETFKSIRRDDIKQAIESYMKNKPHAKLGRSDVHDIVKELERISKQSHIQLTPEMQKELDKQMEALSQKAVEESMKQYMSLEKEKDVKTEKENAKLLKELEKSTVAKEFKEAMERTQDTTALTKEFDRILKSNKVGANLSEAAKARIVKRMVAEQDRQSDGQYSAQEVATLIEKSQRKKETIKKDPPPSTYQEIVEKIEQMKSLNYTYQDKFNTPIHKDMKKTAKAIRTSSQYDTYSELVKRIRKDAAKKDEERRKR